MKTIKGYPINIHIDGTRVTLHDVNKLLIMLSKDENVSEAERNDWGEMYREERQRFLDKLYDETTHKKNILLKLEQRLAKEINTCVHRMERMKAREEERKKQGLEYAKDIVFHLEIDNIYGAGYSEEDEELFDVLFEEYRFLSNWGIPCTETISTDETDKSAFPLLSKLREKHIVAWQDIEMIRKFQLTVDYIY